MITAGYAQGHASSYSFFPSAQSEPLCGPVCHRGLLGHDADESGGSHCARQRRGDGIDTLRPRSHSHAVWPPGECTGAHRRGARARQPENHRRHGGLRTTPGVLRFCSFIGPRAHLDRWPACQALCCRRHSAQRNAGEGHPQRCGRVHRWRASADRPCAREPRSFGSGSRPRCSQCGRCCRSTGHGNRARRIAADPACARDGPGPFGSANRQYRADPRSAHAPAATRTARRRGPRAAPDAGSLDHRPRRWGAHGPDGGVHQARRVTETRGR